MNIWYGGFMLSIGKINLIITIILLIIIGICSFGIIMSMKFQNKQKKKYKECLRLIEEKENGVLSVKDSLNKDEVKSISDGKDSNEFMNELYNIYLSLIDKLNNNNKDFDNILSGFVKEFYENKIDLLVSRNTFEIVDKIELLGYSIIEGNKDKLKFRINISSFNYKKSNDVIISGSNLKRIEQIFIITYIKQDNKWLINEIEKVLEKKLGL